MSERPEPTMGEFLAHLEALVGRIERVFGFAPCARCGIIEKEHAYLRLSEDQRKVFGRHHQFRLKGSVLDCLGRDFETKWDKS